MRREIKFRVWNEELEEMYELRKANYLGSTGIIDPYIGGDKSIWQQYTGLKDKNSVEIYEGDIVETENEKVGYVVFLIQEAGFVVALKDRDYRLGHRNTGEGYSTAENHKVIGNIYENPELLEATK